MKKIIFSAALMMAAFANAQNTGVGITNPTEKLDVDGTARLRTVTTITGTTADKIVVADTDGVLKTINASDLSSAAAATLYSADSSIATDTDNVRTVLIPDPVDNITFSRNSGSTNVNPLLVINGTIKTSELDLNSDFRLKKNVTKLTSDNFDKLIPVSYYWNELGESKGGNKELQYGFIAQDVEKLYPAMVKTDEKGYKSINYIQIIPILTKALQEEREKNEIQDKKIAELTALVNQLLKK